MAAVPLRDTDATDDDMLATAVQAATLLTGDLFPAPQFPAPE